MTNDWRNAMIEEAARMIAEFAAHEGPVDAFHTAKVMIGMFEKALGEATVTPTDDEREVGVDTLPSGTNNVWDGIEWHNDVSDALASVIRRGLAAGFRRSEVPEASAQRGRSRGRHTDEQMLYMICLALEEGLEGVANIDLPDLIVKMISEHWGTADEDTSPEEAEAALAQLEPYIPGHMRSPETQVEPSGAQVEAAAKTLAVRMGDGPWGDLLDTFQDDYRHDARAALRAAFAVGEGGVR